MALLHGKAQSEAQSCGCRTAKNVPLPFSLVQLSTMQFSKEHPIFKASAALDEAAECVEAVPKSFALRFALAYLYATTAGERRCSILEAGDCARRG
jgi:hypothetical protein